MEKRSWVHKGDSHHPVAMGRERGVVHDGLRRTEGVDECGQRLDASLLLGRPSRHHRSRVTQPVLLLLLLLLVGHDDGDLLLLLRQR